MVKFESAPKSAMLKPCEASDLVAIQLRFHAHHIEEGTPALWCEAEDGPPPTCKMVATAITHKQTAIVAFVLSVYSVGSVSCDLIVQALIEHPCLETMNLLHKHSPDIVNFKFVSLRTFLTEACRGPQPATATATYHTRLALLRFLIDHGASPSEGGFGGSGALLPAVDLSMPLEIIDKMLIRGALPNTHVVSAAIQKRQLNVLRLFFERARFASTLSPLKVLDDARRCEDPDIISGLSYGLMTLEQREGTARLRISGNRWRRFWKSG
ncbi:hypothetical protein BBP40_011032 [Aspergillus hancockii]|nr:hypothetical protein BBP40_011032 [Aspergillus hancockii]